MALFKRFDVSAHLAKLETEGAPPAIPATPAVRDTGIAEIARIATTSGQGCDYWRALQAGNAIHVQSSVLSGQRVVWVRDELVKERMAKRHPEAVIYTIEELKELIGSKCPTLLLVFSKPLKDFKLCCFIFNSL